MKKLAALLLVFFLVLTGCTGAKFGQTKEQAALTDDAHRGFKGVTIDFVKNNPPEIVFTGTPLEVVIELKNEGAAPVVGGTLYLSGYDARLFNIQPQSQPFDLEARTRFNTFGGYETISFRSGNIFLPQGTETLDQAFLASACYNYRTEARVPVCIDPNPLSILENEACRTTNPVVVGGGQGAPVAVTAIREESAPGKVSFLITIANQGDGTVVDQTSIGKCPSDLKFNDVDAVRYSVRLSTLAGDCKPVQKARLANKQGTIFCTFELLDAVSPAFTTVLEINLDYGYLSQKSKTTKIKSIS
jgi:hypothetical protein